MSTLTFDAMGVGRLIAHARGCTRWGIGNPAGATEPCLVFVKDEGIYLMSNGLPGLPIGENVVFAKGYAPGPRDEHGVGTEAWAEQYERIRAAVGGDDFAEYLAIAPLLPIPEDATALFIRVTPTRLSVGWRTGTGVPRRKSA